MKYILDENEMLLEIEVKAKGVSDSLVDALISYRKKLNMTQRDVAEVTGIKRANIARIESKRHAITLESLIKYADSLNCDLHFELQERC